MGKNIKSYATIPKVHFPWEREGYLMVKVQIFRLK